MTATPEQPWTGHGPQRWGSGMVTGRDLPRPGGAGWPAPGQDARADASAAAAPDPASDRRRLMLFGGAAAAVAVIGVIVVLALSLTGGGPGWDRPEPVVDLRPPLAQACPAPTGQAPAEPTEPTAPGAEPTAPGAEPTAPTAPGAEPTGPTSPAEPAGGRTVDSAAGISYKAYGAPWQRWQSVWRAGTLDVPYRVGQHFVTETYPGGTYHASILSAAVPAADNDGLELDLECVGRQVAADVRAEYYPQPNTMAGVRDERTTLGGRPAWVTVFRLTFDEPGLRATSELVGVATIDVGRRDCAILYVSIPDTHRELDYVVDEVLASVEVL